MPIEAVASLGELSFEMLEDEEPLEVSAEKALSIWDQIFGYASDGILRIFHILRAAIGTAIRDPFVFPLKCPLLIKQQWVQDQIQIEEKYTSDFWNPAMPLDPSCKTHGMIRDVFAPPQDRVFTIQLKNGAEVEITCRIMETKEKPTYNFVHIPGIYSTIQNNIRGIYPFMEAYVKAKEIPAGRFIVISENNLNYKPTSIDEAGHILMQTLKALKEEFGEIDQILAHSLGIAFLSNVFKQTEDPFLPKNICFDRGFASSWEASKKYFWGLGRLFYLFAKFGNWASNVEDDIFQYCHKFKERPSIVIVGVEQDHYFSGAANLSLSSKLRTTPGVQIMHFDPPRQLAHQYAHHNLMADLLNPLYLQHESDFMLESENFPEAIIRHSLPQEETLDQSA